MTETFFYSLKFIDNEVLGPYIHIHTSFSYYLRVPSTYTCITLIYAVGVHASFSYHLVSLTSTRSYLLTEMYLNTVLQPPNSYVISCKSFFGTRCSLQSETWLQKTVAISHPLGFCSNNHGHRVL